MSGRGQMELSRVLLRIVLCHGVKREVLRNPCLINGEVFQTGLGRRIVNYQMLPLEACSQECYKVPSECYLQAEETKKDRRIYEDKVFSSSVH